MASKLAQRFSALRKTYNEESGLVDRSLLERWRQEPLLWRCIHSKQFCAG